MSETTSTIPTEEERLAALETAKCDAKDERNFTHQLGMPQVYRCNSCGCLVKEGDRALHVQFHDDLQLTIGFLAF